MNKKICLVIWNKNTRKDYIRKIPPLINPSRIISYFHPSSQQTTPTSPVVTPENKIYVVDFDYYNRLLCFSDVDWFTSNSIQHLRRQLLKLYLTSRVANTDTRENYQNSNFWEYWQNFSNSTQDLPSSVHILSSTKKRDRIMICVMICLPFDMWTTKLLPIWNVIQL